MLSPRHFAVFGAKIRMRGFILKIGVLFDITTLFHSNVVLLSPFIVHTCRQTQTASTASILDMCGALGFSVACR